MTEIKDLITSNQRYIIVLCIFILLDMISGIIHAILKQELKSSTFRTGLLKKCLEVIIMIVAFALAWCASVPEIGSGTSICLVVMEGYSILENIEEYVPIPKVLKNFIEQAKQGQE